AYRRVSAVQLQDGAGRGWCDQHRSGAIGVGVTVEGCTTGVLGRGLGAQVPEGLRHAGVEHVVVECSGGCSIRSRG
ncbi:MAG: hypothetical protein ACK56F_10555, partial [bacterium]